MPNPSRPGPRASRAPRARRRPPAGLPILVAATAGLVASGLAATATAATLERAEPTGRGPFSAIRASVAAADPVARLERLADEHPDLVRLHRPLDGDDGFVIAELGVGDDAARRGRPGLLVIAGLDGRHAVGTAAALRIAEALLGDADRLDAATVWIVPRVVEPDLPTGRVAVPDDADHDGRLDEDGPDDLDGDGVVRWMRIADPSPLSGLTATHVVDETDPRIMRPAKPGETPTHAVLREAADDDGDGRYGEDGAGGIDANANFPAHWREFADGSGTWPLELPRLRALADWMLETPNLATTLALAPGDSLAAVPTTRGSGPTNRVPEGLHPDDEAVHGEVAEAFRTITGIAAGERGPRTPGSFDAWSYAHLGLWSFATPLWDRPDRMGALARTGDDEPDASAAGGDRKRPAPASDDAAWLAWIDAERGGAGFRDWTAFEHPQLGPVEIGGLDPNLAVDPPIDLRPRLAERAVTFALDLLDRMPRLEIERVDHRALGGGVHEIAVTVRNAGRLPTRPALAERIRRLAPTLVRLDLDREAILAGPVIGRIERLGAGARETVRWQVRLDAAADAGRLEVIVSDPMHGEHRRRIDDDAKGARP